MEETLKMMKDYLLGYEGKEKLSVLINQYKENKQPNILAYLFISNYGLISNINRLYPSLDDNDKASFCLQELDESLLNFKLDDTKFSTYFIKCYKNRLVTEVIKQNTQKRKIILNCNSIDDTDNLVSRLSYTDDYFNIEDFIKTYKLDNYEAIQCRLLNMGYKLIDIHKILQKSKSLTYKRNENIKRKILKFGVLFS